MSLQRVQACEQCGERRVLGSKESAEADGWRSLNSGALEATFCNRCVRVIVTRALEYAESRTPDPEPSPPRPGPGPVPHTGP